MSMVTANKSFFKMALHTTSASLDVDVYNNYNYDTLGCLHISDSEICSQNRVLIQLVYIWCVKPRETGKRPDMTEKLLTWTYSMNINTNIMSTVLPANSDSDIMFCYKVIRTLESIDHLCINPILRI